METIGLCCLLLALFDCTGLGYKPALFYKCTHFMKAQPNKLSYLFPGSVLPSRASITAENPEMSSFLDIFRHYPISLEMFLLCLIVFFSICIFLTVVTFVWPLCSPPTKRFVEKWHSFEWQKTEVPCKLWIILPLNQCSISIRRHAFLFDDNKTKWNQN